MHIPAHYLEISILKFPDLVTFHTAIFMHKFYNNMLPLVLKNLFTPVNKIQKITKTRTNYGLFNLRQGSNLWNSIDEELKPLSLNLFKREMKKIYLFQY